MSERYGKCLNHYGPNCYECDGTGLSGSGDSYLEEQRRMEWPEKPRYSGGSPSVNFWRYLREEERFYRGMPRTKAMDLAVQAFLTMYEKKVLRK